MPIQNYLIYAQFFIALLISIQAGFYLIARYRTRLAIWCGLLLISLALDLGCYLLQLTNPKSSLVPFFFLMQSIGYTLFCVFWLLFVFIFTRHAHWIRPLNLALVSILPTIYIFMMVMRWSQGLVTNPTETALVGSLMLASPLTVGIPGILFIGFGYGVGLFSIVLLLQFYSKSNSITRKLILPLLSGPILLVATGVMEQAGINPFKPFSIQQLAATTVSYLAFWIIFDLRFGSILSNARETVVDQMQDGVLILDQQDRIVDSNLAAQQLLGLSNKSAGKQPLAQVWAEGVGIIAGRSSPNFQVGEILIPVNGLESTFDINVSQLRDAYIEPIGRVIVFRNVTGRERMEIELQERAHELTRTNKLITALSMVASRLGSAVDSELVLDALGTELRKLDLDCAVVSIDPAGETATIRYVSLNPVLIQIFEKIVGFSLIGHDIPKHYWPGDRILKSKDPVWYLNPRTLLRGLFPKVPEVIAKKVSQALGIQSLGQICILPLISEEKVIGAMPIWGVDLQPDDSPVLAVFASQVASILQKATAYEREIQRANELARSNAMLLALSKVAAQVDSASDFDAIVNTVGLELGKMGAGCVVGAIDDSKQTVFVQYLSVKQDVIRMAEKMTGLSVTDLVVPRHLWPTEKGLAEKTAYWDPKGMRGTLNIIPLLPEKLHCELMKMAGINLDDPVCYLPLTHEEEVIGVMAVWGARLRPEDIPALSVFANQVATAISNSKLYELAQKEIIERTQTETRIRAALDEKEILLKEVHHRVKNNLQIISSLLNLQSAQIPDPKTKDALRESQNRVRSMALIHEKLYQSTDLVRVDFGAYLQNLVNNLVQSYRGKSEKVMVQIHAQSITLDIDAAIPCGLIVNELVSNGLKYAFPENREGCIEISCHQLSNGRYRLVVRDDGVGLPANFDITKSSSLGFKLVTSLVKQLDGNLTMGTTHGVCYEINFTRG